MDIQGNSSYLLKVVRARKDGYILSVRMDANSDLMADFDMQTTGAFGAAMDSASTLVRGLMEDLYAPFKDTDLRFRISPQGEALEHLETGTDKEHLKEALRTGIMRFAQKVMEIQGKELPDFSAERVDHVVDSLHGAFVEVLVNELNYLLRPYAQEYPTSGSIRQPVLVHDVQAPLRKDLDALPATRELGLDRNTPQELICRTITTYDPDALYAAMASERNGLEREGLLLMEECVDHIDPRTGWLTTSTSVHTMRTAKLRMRLETRTVLKPVR
ncbi:MAG: hypothetical protein JST66_04355 [Bacteroidetes bacterium]|nr:hypothetical protein [Bacteroidota bacterium]